MFLSSLISFSSFFFLLLRLRQCDYEYEANFNILCFIILQIVQYIEDFSFFSKCLVFCCLLVFSLLFALRLDDTIEWSYWVIFLPIWFWKLAVICGSTVGSYVWWKHPHYRLVHIFSAACFWCCMSLLPVGELSHR